MVGRRADDPLVAASDVYLERLKHYIKIERRYIKEGQQSTEMSALREALPKNAHAIALDETGKTLSSLALAKQLGSLSAGSKPVVFFLGGANGLSHEFLAACHERWSLSALTLPHRLAQVVLLEQLYRAFTILRHEPYHRG